MYKKTIFLLLIFVISCAPYNDAVVTPSTTLSPSATQIGETLTPSASPTATLVLPQEDASAYRFKPLSEDEYVYIENSIKGEISSSRINASYWEIPKNLVIFYSEQLLLFPKSSRYEEIKWNILFENPNSIIPMGDQNLDLMELFISEMLSKGMSIEEIVRNIEARTAVVEENVKVENLIGNGEDGYVLKIKIPDNSQSIGYFAVFKNNGLYEVEKIKEWDISSAVALGQYYDTYLVGDTNNNTIPELVVQVETCGSGMPGICKQYIFHIEWSNQESRFVNIEFPVYWHTCDDFGNGVCEGEWEFSRIDSKFALITKGSLFTRNQCPNLSFQRINYWDGKNYKNGGFEVLPPDKNLTAECLLAWVETALEVERLEWSYESDDIKWIEVRSATYLNNILNNWTTSIDDMWGPASRDYVKLKLGILYDQIGEHNKSISLLQNLANAPYLAEFDFSSKMASLYLETRDNFGMTQACTHVNDAFAEDFREKIPEPSSIYNFDSDTLRIWGVVDWNGFLCNMKKIFVSELASEKIGSPEALDVWLDRTQINVYEKISVDVFDNGKIDLLALLNTNTLSEKDIWLLSLTQEGFYKPLYIDHYSYSDKSELSIKEIPSDETNNLVYEISLGDELIIVRILPDLTTNILIEEYGVTSYEINQTQESLSLIINIDNQSDGKITNSYLWNSMEQNFIYQPNIFEITQKNIEENIYIKNNYSETIIYIQNFLKKRYSEPEYIFSCSAESGCTYSPPFYIPYFRYLQGLSYEQLGDFENARDIYYELWQDYPDNVFGVVASMKLELVNP